LFSLIGAVDGIYLQSLAITHIIFTSNSSAYLVGSSSRTGAITKMDSVNLEPGSTHLVNTFVVLV
jgi:hypothetical protein